MGMPCGTWQWPKLAKNQSFWYRLEIHLFLCSYQALTFPCSHNLESTQLGLMWDAANKESPNPLSCRWTQQPSHCPPGFAEHAPWTVLDVVPTHLQEDSQSFPPGLSTTMHFLPLNVQSHQRSSECEGISRKLGQEGKKIYLFPQNKTGPEPLYPSPFPLVAPLAENKQMGNL